MKKVFIISAYPNHEGFGAHLADSYLEESLKAGHEATLLDLSKISFDPILHHGYKNKQKLEDDLLLAQKNISWADHLVFFFPIWWGGAPAILKGFFDRVFLPGFAFSYEHGYLPKQLLKNKSARIIVTMDAPALYDSLFLGSAGITLVKKSILQFCGINPVKVTKISRLRYLNDKQRNKVVTKIRQIAKIAD